MAEVTNPLMEKIGPLPAVAWIGGLAGVYVIYRYIQARKAGSATTTVDTQGTGFGLSQDTATPFGSGAGGVGSSVVGSTTPTTGQQTNVDWGNMAANWAIAQGFNPTDVSTAVGSYLYGTGQALNDQQSAILRLVQKQFGTPPEGVILPPPTTPSPVLGQPAPSAPSGTATGPTIGFPPPDLFDIQYPHGVPNAYVPQTAPKVFTQPTAGPYFNGTIVAT